VPPAATQDAFGANYGNGLKRWQYKRNQHRLVQRMMIKYANLEAENIYIVPTNVNIDCVRNYPQHVVKANARSEQMLMRQNNGVHPDKPGYQQIGDSLYCWIKSRLQK
jgi:hypothetical protein